MVRSGGCPGVSSRPHPIVLSLFDDDIGMLHTHEAGSRSANNYVDADNQSRVPNQKVLISDDIHVRFNYRIQEISQ